MEGPDGECDLDLPPSPFQANMPEAVRLAARAGAGIGPLTIYSAIEDIRAGRLVRVLPKYRLRKLNVCDSHS
jgi:DNA-binding transcriptional LysR family regulator